MAIGVNNTNSLVPQGSALSVEQVQRVLVAPLAAQSVFLSSGVSIIDSPNPVRLPIAPDPNEALAWVSEGAQIPETSPSFDAITLLPSTMESVKVISRFTRELARQSVVAIDAALQTNLVSSVAATLDHAFISGAGNGTTTIKGLLNFAGTQSLAVDGAVTVDDLYDALELALTAFVSQSELVWWVHPNTYTALHKLKATGTGNYLLQPDPAQSGRQTLLGIPVTVTTRLPVADNDPDPDSVTAVLWAPGRTTVVRDTSPSVTILPERYAEFDEIGIRVTARYDLGSAKPESIVKLTGITAS